MSAPALTPTQQAHDYLTAVERELDDLPADDRAALLEDLALHLDALAAEDDDRPVPVRLGPPAVYAADLRAAAGLPARSGGSAAGGIRPRVDAVLASAAFRWGLPALRGVRRLLVELRPAWWVLRGYLVVLVVSLLGSDRLQSIPVPAPLHSHVLGVLLVLAAVAGSVALGRRKLPKLLGALVVAAGVLLVLVAAGAALDLRGDIRNGLSAASWAPGPQLPDERYPLLSRYGPVTDVLPYAADGTPLEDVLLYDQDGRPLRVGFQEWWADTCLRTLEQPQAADGVPVPHLFPQVYELLGEGVDLDTALPRPGRCTDELPRPAVPLPVFPPDSTPPPAGTAAPDPGD